MCGIAQISSKNLKTDAGSYPFKTFMRLPPNSFSTVFWGRGASITGKLPTYPALDGSLI